MTGVGKAFKDAFGEPLEKVPNGITFQQSFAQMAWNRMYEEIGAGWFRDRFLYLFGEGLEQLQPCLKAWSFLMKEEKERTIIGRNAYGALLVAENISTKGLNAPICLLDPIRVNYWSDTNLGFVNLIGHWLPENKIPGFLDNALFLAWNQVTKDTLDFKEILAIKTPVPLGGKLEASNFQIEDIISYYQSTGLIYADLSKK